ncbi:MAG: 23S rRNA (guanosine(2251)-2'-O)-methyltransferase RlmB [Marinicaulis sp.]|nr:23S rRNA (guanosine(2251)-2'-O)-methyltransferase RlmB [Marinicaulis sp.]
MAKSGKHHAQKKQSRPKRREGSGRTGHDDAPLWIYGRHAVAAVLKNPKRRVIRAMATKNGLDWLGGQNVPSAVIDLIDDAKPDQLDATLPAGAVHQGVAALTHDLPRARLKEICAEPGASSCVIVLDQITDPQNIGAIFRSAAAFGASAIIAQDRRTPPLSGALAKAAVGAVETIPCIRVVNVARALEALRDQGFFCAGLTGDADALINDIPNGKPLAIVVGAEGAGLRRLVGATCDGLFKIPINSDIESLNVSTATAIALYSARQKR